MKHILITGGSGQVGFELQRQFAPFAVCISAPSRLELDLNDASAVEHWLEYHQPDVILNAAAFTAVDQAETQHQAARRLNAELPAQLADYARKHNAALVHYSTDYVYPGHGDTPWKEGNPTEPLSVYGQTKLDGDQAVQTAPYYLIFRTSWVYAARGKNFMNTMRRLGCEHKTLKIVADQIGAPTPARLIAQMTNLAMDRNIPAGLYHLAPRGQTSWHGFACAIFEQMARLGNQHIIHPDRVAAIPTEDYPTPARRPLNSRLAVHKIEQALAITLPDWHSQLTLTLEEALSYEQNPTT